MSTRPSLPLWVVVSVFAASAAAVPLADRLLHPPAMSPRSLAELIQSVSASHPSFHVVPVLDQSMEAGVYFCERPRSIQQLMSLPRTPEYVNRWGGVVYCERIGQFSEISPEVLESWGDHGLRIGMLQLFGDPDLLRRIQHELRPRERGGREPEDTRLGVRGWFYNRENYS